MFVDIILDGSECTKFGTVFLLLLLCDERLRLEQEQQHQCDSCDFNESLLTVKTDYRLHGTSPEECTLNITKN